MLKSRRLEIAPGVSGVLELQRLTSGEYCAVWRQDGQSREPRQIMGDDLGFVDELYPITLDDALDEAEVIIRAHPHAGVDGLSGSDSWMSQVNEASDDAATA